jgi:fructose-1,6-bisphosphatase/inositol monophosphatase family enzyme
MGRSNFIDAFLSVGILIGLLSKKQLTVGVVYFCPNSSQPLYFTKQNSFLFEVSKLDFRGLELYLV